MPTCKRGRQTFDFAQPPLGGRCGLTVIAGGGTSGKTSLLSALRLALWGARGSAISHPVRLAGRRRTGEVPTDPRTYINVDALGAPDPHSHVGLTICADRSTGTPQTMQIKRSWRVVEGETVTEDLRVEILTASGRTRFGGVAAQRRISAWLPPGRLPLLFSDGEEFEVLGGLAERESNRRSAALNSLGALTRGCTVESWQRVTPGIIELANRLLLCGRENEELLLLPESAGCRQSGAYQLCPGVWLSREPDSGTQFACIGSALVLGLHLAGGANAPLVLDAPTARMPQVYAAVFLEVLSGIARSQVVIAAHESQIGSLVVLLWERAQIVYLVENRKDACSSLLSEPATR